MLDWEFIKSLYVLGAKLGAISVAFFFIGIVCTTAVGACVAFVRSFRVSYKAARNKSRNEK